MASSDRSATPPQGSAQREGSSTIHSYLHPVISLDDSSQDTLKSLLQVTVELRRSTSQIQRVQGGAPGNYTFGPILTKLQPQVNGISRSLEDIFTTCERFPGMYLVKSQFAMFKNIVNGDFYDDKGSGNHEERVHLLEKLMYVTGMLRGHLEMVLEQHSYWKAKLAGEQPPHLVRRLDFNRKIDPAPKRSGHGLWSYRTRLQAEEEPSEAVLTSQSSDAKSAVSSADSAHEESSSTQHTFKASVCLPEEVETLLVSLWEDQKYTDITFLINSHPVPAHKAILASQSPYFERMLFGELKEASVDKIPLQNVPLEAFQKVLQFAYSGTLHMKECTLQAILEVVAVADRFSFVVLKEALEDQLSCHISLDTVILLLVHSDTHHLPELHKKCLCFIENKANTNEILQSASFLDLSEESLIGLISRDTLFAPESDILQAVVRWKEHNERSAEELTRVLEHIRLTEFSPQEIFNEIEPLKLFSEERILTTVRLHHMPSVAVAEMCARGRKESNKNLFTKPTAVVDLAASSFYTLSKQWYPTSPYRNVADTVIKLGSPRGSSVPTLSPAAQIATKHTCGSEQLDGCTIVFALDDIYIINYLHIKGYPGVSDEVQVSKSFSYTVKVSRDKSNWLELFDYSSFACRGAQHLPFPKQAARYIRVDLTGKQDTTQPTPLQLSACCYVENQQPFKFLPKGVIAPQYEQEVVTIPSTVTTDSKQVCVAYFSQPYSASLIKFHLKCSDPSVVEVDITVSVGVSSNLEERKALQDMERTPLQSQVIVETQERVIGYVAVTVRKLHKRISVPKPRPHKKVELRKAKHRERIKNLKEEKATNELYRLFQDILNKMTPQNFQALAEQALDLQIDSEERLEGVVNLIFTKALEEPNFSTVYANLCKVLSPIKVEWTLDWYTDTTTFCSVLLTKYQEEFEKNKGDNEERKTMLAAIEKAETEELKKQLTEEMEEAEAKAQRRLLGNIRFIGELFKVKMLPEKLIHECIRRLFMSSSDEKSLECLAKLITTTGKDLDHPEAKLRIDNYFACIEDIIQKGKISARMKFILEDLKELRQNSWMPRNRQDSSLKIIDQDGKSGQTTTASTAGPGDDDCGGGGGGDDGGGEGECGKSGLCTGRWLAITPTTTSTAKLPHGVLKKMVKMRISSNFPRGHQLGWFTRPPVPMFDSSKIQLSVPKEFQFGDSTPHQEGDPVPSTAQAAQTIAQPLSPPPALSSPIVPTIPERPVFTIVDVLCRATL